MSSLFFATRGERVELTTILPIAECRRRIEAATDDLCSIGGSRRVIGRVSANRLRARMRIRYRNSFQTWMIADIIEDGAGARIRCRFALHPLVATFIGVWFLVVLLVCGAFLATAVVELHLRHEELSANAWSGLLFPVFMLTAGIALLWAGGNLAKDERGLLIDFLRGTLEATPIQPPIA